MILFDSFWATLNLNVIQLAFLSRDRVCNLQKTNPSGMFTQSSFTMFDIEGLGRP